MREDWRSESMRQRPRFVSTMADYRMSAGRLNPSSSLSSIASLDKDRDLRPFSKTTRPNGLSQFDDRKPPQYDDSRHPVNNYDNRRASKFDDSRRVLSQYEDNRRSSQYDENSLYSKQENKRQTQSQFDENRRSQFDNRRRSSVNFQRPQSDEAEDDQRTLTSKKKRKKKSQITVNLGGTRYDIVRQMAEHLGYTVTREDDQNSFLFWNDAFVSTERISDMKPFQHMNHFPGMGEVTRKDCLARNMAKIQKALQEDFSFSPQTWVLPADNTALSNYAKDLRAKKKHKTFIVKPPNASQGHGIGLYRNVDKIPPNEQYIVQEYIDKPLLIEGYKFDLRIYVLVTSCDPLRIFLFNDGLVRLSTEKYLPPQDNNLNRLYMHLTNYSINKHNEFYEKGSTVETGSKRSIRFFNEYLRRNDYDVVQLWKNISDLIIKTMIVSLPHVLHAYRMCRPGSTANNDSVCFEVLGFDVIIDRKMKPWLLEINRSPSFGTDEKIDFDIKSGVIEDTLRLLNIKLSDKKRNLAAQKAEAQKRLMRPSKRLDMNGEVPEAEKKRISLERRKEELKDLLSRIRRNAAREEFENKHSGRFRRIFPTADRHGQEKYTSLILTAFQTFLSSRAASMQRELELVYSNKLREQQVVEMLAECEGEERGASGANSRGPKPLSSMPSSIPQPADADEDSEEEEEESTSPPLRMSGRQSRPGSASYGALQPPTNIARSRPNSAHRPVSGRRSRSPNQVSRSKSLNRPAKASRIPPMEEPVDIVKDTELTDKTLAALNDMRIKFPGKTDEEAEWMLDKLHENWKFHKPRIASYWLVKLDSIKRRKVIDIVRSNVRAVIQRIWRFGEIENLRLCRIINRVFNRLLWSHGQGLWNCFSPSGNSWETIFSKSSDSITVSELNCCRRVVQLCRDCLLIVYQFAAEAKTAGSAEGGDAQPAQPPSNMQSSAVMGGTGRDWKRTDVGRGQTVGRTVGQKVVQLYQSRAESLGT